MILKKMSNLILHYDVVLRVSDTDFQVDARKDKEDTINAFLDRLEGETLGRMLDYLSRLTFSLTWFLSQYFSVYRHVWDSRS